MAEGLLIDLKSAQKVSALKLITSTPGMTVQVYGATAQHGARLDHRPGLGSAEPATLTSKKRHDAHQAARLDEGIPLRDAVDQQAPAAAVGTAEAPGHVSVNELELFPAK